MCSSDLMKVDLPKLRPQLDVLMNVLNGQICVHFDFGDPGIILKGLLDGPLFSRGDLKDEGGNVLRLSPI